MSGFNPDEWETTEKVAKISLRKIALKGSEDVEEIDVDELEKILSNLRDNAFLPVRSLRGEIRDNFNNFDSYVRLLADSPSYPEFMSYVDKYFGNLDKTSIIPGTVAAYCYGCSAVGEEGGCSPICAGSAPGVEENFRFCEHSVIVGSYEKGEFDFTAMRIVDNSHGFGHVYVSFDSYEKFPGFSSNEKGVLSRKYGLSKIVLKGSDSNNEYFNLLSDDISVADIKSRVNSRHNGSNYDDHSDSVSNLSGHSENGTSHKKGRQGMIIALVVIFIIVLALILAYSYYSSNNERTEKK